MEERAIHGVEYVEALKGYSLSELEDIFSHLDRDTFPGRFNLVKAEIDARLKELDVQRIEEVSLGDIAVEAPGILRRICSGLVDFCVQGLVPFLIFFLLQKVLFPSPQAGGGGGGGGRGGGRGGRGRGGGNQSNDLWSDITGFIEGAKDLGIGLVGGDPAALAQAGLIWNDYGTILTVLIFLRLFLTLAGWSRSGHTPGMRELGIRVVRTDGGSLTLFQAIARFVLQHILFIFTAGISGLWMLWDRDKRALHDKLIGAQLVRVQRVWEKAEDARRFD